MAIIDGLVAAGVLLGFLYIIYAKLIQKNPAIKDKVRGLWDGLDKTKKKEDIKDKMQQTYDDRRTMM